MIAAGIGGAVIGSFEVHASTFTFPSLLAIPTYLGNGFLGEIIGLIIAFFGAVILTYLFGVSNKSEIMPTVKALPNEVLVPVEGQVVSLTSVNDEVFASEAMGKGAAIIPSSGVVSAPVNGKIGSVYKTGHAIGIVSDSGIELLIHIGINTVKLKGQHFKPVVKENDQIKIGDKLVGFNLNKL